MYCLVAVINKLRKEGKFMKKNFVLGIALIMLFTVGAVKQYI
jgi:hypothetical protein